MRCTDCRRLKRKCTLGEVFFSNPPSIESSDSAVRRRAKSNQTKTLHPVSASSMKKSISEGARVESPPVTRSGFKSVPGSPQKSSFRNLPDYESIEKFHQVLEDGTASEYRIREYHASLQGAWIGEQARREVLSLDTILGSAWTISIDSGSEKTPYLSKINLSPVRLSRGLPVPLVRRRGSRMYLRSRSIVGAG